jgi:hypothetical protein
MADTATIIVDAKGATACGQSLDGIAKAAPTLFRDAVGMQVRNTQKAIAAVQRNYAIKHKVDGKTRTLRKFPPRHPITVALHGKKADGALTKVSSISATYNDGHLEVGFKGRLSRYCSAFQEGGKTGFTTDPTLARRVQLAMRGDELRALLDRPDFRHECYRRLGSALGIHNQEQLNAASRAQLSKARVILDAFIVRHAGDFGVALPSLPDTWQGRPYMDELAADLTKRFVPALVAIIEKKINGTIKRRPA